MLSSTSTWMGSRAMCWLKGKRGAVELDEKTSVVGVVDVVGLRLWNKIIDSNNKSLHIG